MKHCSDIPRIIPYPAAELIRPELIRPELIQSADASATRHYLRRNQIHLPLFTPRPKRFLAIRTKALPFIFPFHFTPKQSVHLTAFSLVSGLPRRADIKCYTARPGNIAKMGWQPNPRDLAEVLDMLRNSSSGDSDVQKAVAKVCLALGYLF